MQISLTCMCNMMIELHLVVLDFYHLVGHWWIGLVTVELAILEGWKSYFSCMQND